MKVSHVFLVCLVFSLPLNVFASETIETQSTDAKKEVRHWFEMLQNALTTMNFDAGVVTNKGRNTISYRWIHGKLENGVEVESLQSLVGDGATTVRQNNKVSYIENNKEAYSVTSNSIRKFIPSVFYQDYSILSDSYQFVSVSKSSIAGRITQLIRLESKQKDTYNYWVWLDEETGLPLRLAFVNEDGEVVEQTILTHLRVLPANSEELSLIANMNLPEPATEQIASQQEMNSWQLNWLPNGFDVIKSDRHHIPMSREVSDYFLFGDGLVEFSVYIQRPLNSFESPLVLNEGATTLVMHRANGFDVTVVGRIPADSALKIAQSVSSKQ